jgi:alpha-mannosidase
MNWRWGYQETASVTVDTFRTILDLMKEYPDLTFAQSQAATYEIIEKYAPSMLDEIRARVREGRWEVSASTWVETDKNMPSGESLARHILYTKRYLTKLFDISPESLSLDFEPDTFGHNISVPEICAKGGVKYYYHCRGNDKRDEDVSVWRARSGAELLVYREPHWYNATVEPNMLRETSLICEKYGINCLLNVYGVGDHGGGPTRRDVERLIEMASWPIMPDIFFSTYNKFFKELDAFRSKLPVREGELNFLFDGCYTSESRIKMANRIAEDRINESETLCAAAVFAAEADFGDSFKTAWKKILFNHFHDILPGSGIVDTREYAMGEFQSAMAAITTNANCAMRSIAEKIDTSPLSLGTDFESVSEGAGVGYFVDQGSHYGMPRPERGSGKRRAFHLFNTTQYDYDGVAQLTVFDWEYDVGRALFTDSLGKKTECKLLGSGKQYWGHKYKKFALSVRVPAFGYATYTLDTAPVGPVSISPLPHERTDTYTGDSIVLENSHISAEFDHITAQLISLIDKKTGGELIGKPSCTFRLITENTVHGMSAWRVGDYMKIRNLNEECNVRVSEINTSGIHKWIRYDLGFSTRSKLAVTVSLGEDSSMLDFDTMIDFHETGSDAGVPQVNFTVPLGYGVSKYRYDVPFGFIDRDPLDYDVPANSFAATLPCDAKNSSLMLVSDSKYGFRGTDNSISLNLLRASYNPDPYPEYGIHNMRLGVGIASDGDINTLYRMAAAFVHPLPVCTARNKKAAGTLPLDGSFMTLEGDVKISAIKMAEDILGVVVRLSEVKGRKTDFRLTFMQKPASAYATDINENIQNEIKVDGFSVNGSCEAYGVGTILIKFEND